MNTSYDSTRNFTSGLTLVELMITTAMLAIVLQIAVPYLGGVLAAWQRDFATRAIADHLVLSRSEAIRWSRRVVMCSSANGLNCLPSSNKEWKSGWIVFQDIDSNGQFSAGDQLVAVSQGMTGIQSLKGNATVQRFVFLPTGMMASGMATLEVIPRTGISQKITVNRIGRVRLSLADAAGTS